MPLISCLKINGLQWNSMAWRNTSRKQSSASSAGQRNGAGIGVAAHRCGIWRMASWRLWRLVAAIVSRLLAYGFMALKSLNVGGSAYLAGWQLSIGGWLAAGWQAFAIANQYISNNGAQTQNRWRSAAKESSTCEMKESGARAGKINQKMQYRK